MNKPALRRLFRFVLEPFERGDQPYAYKPLNRKILIAVGVLFLVLFFVAAGFAMHFQAPGYALPVLVFFAAGATCLIIGLLGSDRAVSKIWGNR